MARRFFPLLVALLISGAPAFAQTAGQQAQTPPPAAATPAVPPVIEVKPDAKAYLVGPDDTLSIVIYGEDSLEKIFKVGPDGLINYPFLGDMKVAGLSVRQIEAEIRKRLMAGGVFTDPQVVGEVTSYRSQTVQVTGQVNSPGDITLQGTELSLSRALAKAQLTALAGSYVEIRRRKPGTSIDEVGPDAFDLQRVDRKDLDELRVDPRLQDGDHVFVPKAPQFFLTGYVKQVGPQVWTPNLTVGRAIAAAGGLSDRGTMNGLKIKRLVNGEYKEFDADENTIIQQEDQIVIRQRRF